MDYQEIFNEAWARAIAADDRLGASCVVRCTQALAEALEALQYADGLDEIEDLCISGMAHIARLVKASQAERHTHPI